VWNIGFEKNFEGEPQRHILCIGLVDRDRIVVFGRDKKMSPYEAAMLPRKQDWKGVVG
jgi:hypothetical protein